VRVGKRAPTSTVSVHHTGVVNAYITIRLLLASGQNDGRRKNGQQEVLHTTDPTRTSGP
jgi:hypothetical protein